MSRSASSSPRSPTLGMRPCVDANSLQAPLRLRALPARAGVEASARVDPQLAEHLVQVPLDGARTEEQLGADLRVGQAVAGEPRDLLLLRCESSRGSRRRPRGFAPAATSSPRARSANASIPISANISSAARSRSRASRRRPWRRSHSPKTRCARASSVRIPRPIQLIDRLAIRRLRPRRRRSSSARQRASMPSAKSLPRGLSGRGQSVQRIPSEFGVPGARGRLDRARTSAHMAAREGCLLVTTLWAAAAASS